MSAPVKREEVRDLLKSAFGPGDVATMTGIFSRVTGKPCWRLLDVPDHMLQAVWVETKNVIDDRANQIKDWPDVIGEPRTPAVAPVNKRYTDDDDVLGDYAPAHEVVAVRESGDGIATPAQRALTETEAREKPRTDVLVAKIHEADEVARLRKAMLVSISDVGLCMNDLGTILIQDLRDDTVAKRGGIAIGVRRAAWRIEHGSLDGFDIEENRRKRHVDIEPFIGLLRDVLKHFDARTFADPVALEDEEIELIRQIDALLPKAAKPKTMEA